MATYIGIPPLLNISQLTAEPDFVVANDILLEVTQTVLSQGLPCNTDYDFILSELRDELTAVPEGALICDVSTDDRYVERDTYIYNMYTKEFETRVDLKANIVWDMTFDELPELVKRYIITVSSRAFVGRIKGDAALSQMTIPDERRTKQEFQRYVFKMGDWSMLDDPSLDFITRRLQYYRRY
jgi:hypothetical protein